MGLITLIINDRVVKRVGVLKSMPNPVAKITPRISYKRVAAITL